MIRMLPRMTLIVISWILLLSSGCCFKVSREFINGGDQVPLMTTDSEIANLGPGDAVLFAAGNLERVLVPNEVAVRYMVPCDQEPKKPKEPKEPKKPKEPKEPKKPKEPKEPKKPKEPKQPKQPKGKAPFLIALKFVKHEGKWKQIAEVKKALPNNEIPLLLVVFNSGSAAFKGNIRFFDHVPDGTTLGSFVGTKRMVPNPLVYLPYIGLLVDPYSFLDSSTQGQMIELEGIEGVKLEASGVSIGTDEGLGFEFMLKLPSFPKQAE